MANSPASRGGHHDVPVPWVMEDIIEIAAPSSGAQEGNPLRLFDVIRKNALLSATFQEHSVRVLKGYPFMNMCSSTQLSSWREEERQTR